MQFSLILQGVVKKMEVGERIQPSLVLKDRTVVLTFLSFRRSAAGALWIEHACLEGQVDQDNVRLAVPHSKFRPSMSPRS
ncbi:hypothetical protein NL676_005452 [Syzygium grande]|nr:hypothetical protein NL676_005452 [Syzygium grande]